MAVWHTHFESATADLGLTLSGRELPDRKAVRQAYSRLAKIHRPDDDPDGFQRIRAAYEAVMEGLEHGVIHEDDEDDESDDEALRDRIEHQDSDREHVRAEAQAGDADRDSANAMAAPALPESDGQWIDTTDQDIVQRRRTRPAAAVVPTEPDPMDQSASTADEQQLPARATVLPDWARSLENDSALLEDLRSAMFEALAAQPQDAGLLQARTARLLACPALEQLQHRLEVRNWLVSLAAWHPGSTLTWRAQVAAHYGIDQSGLADYREEGLAQLIHRLEVDSQVDAIEEQARRLPKSVEAAWLHGASWWALIRMYMVATLNNRSELVRQTLEHLAPERINAHTQARWQGLQGFARPSATGMVVLMVTLIAFISPALREVLAPGAALLLTLPAALGCLMGLLWAAGAGLRRARSLTLERHPFAFNVAELVLGLLLLVCGGMSTLKDMEGLTPLFIALLLPALLLWILTGSMRLLFLHGPFETLGIVMLVGLCSIPVLMAAGLEDYRWVTYVSGWVLIQAWSPLSAISRTDQGPYLWRGGGGFTLPLAVRYYAPIALHLLHAMISLGLNDAGEAARLLLTASGLILLYANVLLMGMPEKLVTGSSRLFIVFYLMFAGLGAIKGVRDWSPGLSRALLDALMMLWLGMGWWKTRQGQQG